MTDNVTRLHPPKKPERAVYASDNLRPSQLFSDMPRLPKEERVRRRREIQARLDTLEDLMNAELKAIRSLIALDDL